MVLIVELCSVRLMEWIFKTNKSNMSKTHVLVVFELFCSDEKCHIHVDQYRNSMHKCSPCKSWRYYSKWTHPIHSNMSKHIFGAFCTISFQWKHHPQEQLSAFKAQMFAHVCHGETFRNECTQSTPLYRKLMVWCFLNHFVLLKNLALCERCGGMGTGG